MLFLFYPNLEGLQAVTLSSADQQEGYSGFHLHIGYLKPTSAYLSPSGDTEQSHRFRANDGMMRIPVKTISESG